MVKLELHFPRYVSLTDLRAAGGLARQYAPGPICMETLGTVWSGRRCGATPVAACWAGRLWQQREWRTERAKVSGMAMTRIEVICGSLVTLITVTLSLSTFA